MPPLIFVEDALYPNLSANEISKAATELIMID